MNANRENFAYIDNLTGNIDDGFISGNTIKKEAKKLKFAFYLKKILKRLVDIIGGIVGVLLLIPITIGIKIANIVSKDYGPLFYKQKRIGKYEEAKKEYDTYKKLKDDPRITKVGHFIRNTSLDEFPQFINVLKGDMSLVGPRPYLPREKEDMGRLYDKITLVKPGITGMWQVSGRSELTFKERLDMDVEYYYNWSLKEDIKLIFKTIKNCILKKGAI